MTRERLRQRCTGSASDPSILAKGHCEKRVSSSALYSSNRVHFDGTTKGSDGMCRCIEHKRRQIHAVLLLGGGTGEALWGCRQSIYGLSQHSLNILLHRIRGVKRQGSDHLALGCGNNTTRISAGQTAFWNTEGVCHYKVKH